MSPTRAAVAAQRRGASSTGPAGSAPARPAPDDDPLVALMVADGYDLDAVLSGHRDDGTGHCHTCGGPQSGRYRWPCRTRDAADRAAAARSGAADVIVAASGAGRGTR